MKNTWNQLYKLLNINHSFIFSIGIKSYVFTKTENTKQEKEWPQ